jgi:hypothetical protein
MILSFEEEITTVGNKTKGIYAFSTRWGVDIWIKSTLDICFTILYSIVTRQEAFYIQSLRARQELAAPPKAGEGSGSHQRFVILLETVDG